VIPLPLWERVHSECRLGIGAFHHARAFTPAMAEAKPSEGAVYVGDIGLNGFLITVLGVSLLQSAGRSMR
jgi:hypothetical protein